MTVPGGINSVYSFIEVEDAPEIKGSFNTTYVYSYDNISLLQSYIFGLESEKEDGSATISEIPEYYRFTKEENTKRGLIQKEQSITGALIVAYEAAKENGHNVNIDYEFKGLIIHFYCLNQTVLKIGDIITGFKIHQDDKIIDVDTKDPARLEKAFLVSKPGDIVCSKSHIGIVSGKGKTISASAKANKVTENDWGFRSDDNVRFYRYLKG